MEQRRHESGDDKTREVGQEDQEKTERRDDSGDDRAYHVERDRDGGEQVKRFDHEPDEDQLYRQGDEGRFGERREDRPR